SEPVPGPVMTPLTALRCLSSALWGVWAHAEQSSAKRGLAAQWGAKSEPTATLKRRRIPVDHMPRRTRPPDTAVGHVLGFPQGVVFLAVVFLAHMPEVRDFRDPAVLPVLGVVDLAMSCAFAAARKD